MNGFCRMVDRAAKIVRMPDWSALSEFLLCEDHKSTPARMFVLHTRFPRCLVEIVDRDWVREVFPINAATAEELDEVARRSCEFVGGERC
jgi:hypothetical protein